MYEEYLREREGKEIVKNDYGFAIYGFNCIPGVDFSHCYLSDIYVKPAFRKQGVARGLADLVAKEAQNRGHKVMFGSVDTTANNHQASLQVLKAYGMRMYCQNENAIYMIKEL